MAENASPQWRTLNQSKAAAEGSTSDKILLTAFQQFDTDNDGKIGVQDLGTVMRSLGYHPSPEEVRELVNGSEGSGQLTARGGFIDFELFARLMRRKAREEDTEAELKSAFRELDQTGQGWIDPAAMRKVCKVLGEDLTEDEVRQMVSEAISNFDDKIYYVLCNDRMPPASRAHRRWLALTLALCASAFVRTAS